MFNEDWDDEEDYDTDEESEPDPGCVLGDKCICPHPYHLSSECYDLEFAQQQQNDHELYDALHRYPFNGSITTYPNSDENQHGIYETCARLESEGLVVRNVRSEKVVIFRLTS